MNDDDASRLYIFCIDEYGVYMCHEYIPIPVKTKPTPPS